MTVHHKQVSDRSGAPAQPTLPDRTIKGSDNLVLVLLVEDDPKDQELVKTALTRRGLKVKVARSDLEAYGEINKGSRFDLLIADINLGRGTTGFDVARSARVRWPDLPVAYLTALHVDIELHAVPGGRAFVKALNINDTVDAILAQFAGPVNDEGDAAQSRPG